MNKKILIVLANYYKDISDGLLKSALKNIPRSNRVKIIRVPGVFAPNRVLTSPASLAAPCPGANLKHLPWTGRRVNEAPGRRRRPRPLLR